ncbi:MAG: hypothetical protein EA384_04690 [Spirochaetaceae bacterium]|nr:MAG: hypothetical protein EA384_04690 [Spirochaetaceae bacterium]
MRSPWRLLLVTAVMAAVTGCTTVRFLEDDQQLYSGAAVDVASEERVPGKRSLASDLEDVVRPLPNRAWFGIMRPRVWIYHAVGEADGPGLRAWVVDRFAEEPVLFEQVSPESNAGRMRSWLMNHGYFEADVQYSIVERRRTAGLQFDVVVHQPYRIGSISWPQDDSALSEAIRATSAETLIRPAEVYRLETLREERIRIDRALKNVGFYAFTPDFLLFEADLDQTNRTVELELTVKDDTPQRARRRHSIDRITVYAEHSPGRREPPEGARTIEIAADYDYIGSEPGVRPEVVVDAIPFKPGDTYSRALHLATINRLMSLGVYRFVNIRYQYIEASEALHAIVYLTPVREKMIEGELQMVTRSNDFAGPGLQLRYRDRNAFGGAEEFTIDASSAFETRLGTEQLTLDSWEVGADMRLTVPRIVAPFVDQPPPAAAVLPRTGISVGFNTLTRVDTYRLDQISGSFGYDWSPRREIRHQLRPLEVTFVRPRDFSREFDQLLDQNPSLRRSFEEQFIIGGSYSLFYNDQMHTQRRNNTVVNVNVNLAGNLLSAVWGLYDGQYPDADDPALIMETPYSQFVRLDNDVRYFVPLTERSKLAVRLLAGAGYAFGNASALPRIKQFSVGGTNSIRAFQGRTIGPGAVPPQSEGGPALERSGDMRLETNLEYRFPIVGVLKGALFADAGNIWTLGHEQDQTTGLFDPQTLLDQTAVGAGLGVRIDPSFFVLRLDVAAPLHKPWRDKGDRWVIDAMDFSDREWRRDNLVFNLAIGYPY